jgi:hypothetical protein
MVAAIANSRVDFIAILLWEIWRIDFDWVISLANGNAGIKPAFGYEGGLLPAG